MAVVSDIEIRLRADIARLQTDMNAARRSVDGAMGGITQAAAGARNALMSIAGGLGAGALASMVDQYVKFTSQLKLATQSQREYNAAYADVKRIAAGSTQSLQETGVLYARIANGVRELGVSQKQVAAITETVNLALLVSGATANEAASAQLQLSQAFASGTLRGEEFNAVNEAAPRLMKALADGIGVPVGALKKMAEEGLITSEIMANVLPNALSTLREEAKNIQTISGSFTLLKNNAIEFVGSTAQASGAVTAISTLLSALANNLNLVAGALLTVVAVKIANFFDAAIARTVAAVAANNALIASNLATAQAEFAAANAADRLAGSRLNEVRAATLAATGNVQLALTTNGLIPAQNRAAATSVALTSSYFGLAGAQAAATLGARALNAALAFTGGPLGLIITLLGVAATAWGYYEYSQTKANEKAAEDTKESASEMTENLAKVNEMLRERARLQSAGAGEAVTGDDPRSQELRDTLREINDLKARGAALDASDQIRLISLQGIYNGLNKEMTDNITLRREQEANGQAAKALVSVRERLTGINGQYLKELGLLQTALAKGAIEQSEYTDLVSRLAKETYAASDAGKAGAEAAKKSEQAAKDAGRAAKEQAQEYADLISNLTARAAATAREAEGLTELTKAEEASLELTEKLRLGKIKLTAAQEGVARSLIQEAGANDVLAASRKADEKLQQQLANNMRDLAAERYTLIESAKQEAEQNELAVKTFGMAEAAIIRLNAARLIEQETQRLGRSLTEDEIADLNRVIALKERSAQAVAARVELEAAKTFWTDIEKTAHDTFVSIADGGKGAFQRLKDTAKNTFFDWLYQQTLKKWIINIGTSVMGAGIAGAAQASGGAASSMSGIAGLIGSVKGIGAGALQTAGAVLTGQAGLGSTISAGFSALATGTASGISAGLASLAGTLGPIALGVAAAVKAFGRGPKEYSGNSTINGSFGAEGFTGTVDADWIKKGGWLRSDKKGVDSKPLEEALSAGLAQAYEAIKTSSSQYAGALGIDAKNIADRAQKVKIALGKDGVANEKAITDFLGTVADSVAKELLPAVGQFSKIGESASQTFERIAIGYKVVEEAVASMGGSFGAVGVDSIAARERLIELAGGVEKFATDTSGFQQNFLSEAERNAPVLARVTDKLKELGLAGVVTRDQFRDAVMGLTKNGALATAEGAKQYAELIGLQADVAQVFPDATAARSLEVELMRLQGRESEALAAERKYELSAMDAALRPLQERVWALADEKAAVEARSALEIEIMTLLGDKAGALAAERKYELSAMDAVLRPLQERAWALADEKAAVESRTALEVEIMTLLGDKAGALAATRKNELREMDATLRPLQERAWALADEKAAVESRTALEVEIMTLLGDKAGALAVTRRDELREMDATLRPLQERAWALADEKAAVESRTALEVEIMTLLGDKAGALAVTRRGELREMDAASRPLQERIYALQDEAAAVETANALLDIQAQIYELNGDKAGAASVLTRQHAAALALLDPALRGATQQLWSLEAAAKAIEKAKTNSTKLVEGVESAFSVLQSVSQSQKKILEADVKAREKSVENLRKISDSSRAAFDALRTPEDLRKDQRLAVAEIMSAVVIARAGGPLPDEKNLQRAIKDLGAGLEQDNYASYIDYQRELAQTRNALGELANLSDGALTIEEQSLRAVEDQIKLIDLTLEKAQEQVDVLKGISVIGISIEQAVRALDLSLAVANNDPLTAAKSAINKAYKDALGRAPDAAGAEWWSDKVAGGTAISDVVGAITNSTEAQLRAMYKSVLGREADSAGVAFWSKAFGSTIDASEYAEFIRGAQPELNQAPPIAYTAPASGTMPAGTVSALQEEMSKRMDAKMSRMVEGIEKFASQFENVSGGGQSLFVENVNAAG